MSERLEENGLRRKQLRMDEAKLELVSNCAWTRTTTTCDDDEKARRRRSCF